MTDNQCQPDIAGAKLLKELEAATYVVLHGPNWTLGLGDAEERAIVDALRASVARSGVLTEQEPVAWRMKNDWDHWYITQDKAFADTCRDIEKMEVQPLYVSSPLPSAHSRSEK